MAGELLFCSNAVVLFSGSASGLRESLAVDSISTLVCGHDCDYGR